MFGYVRPLRDELKCRDFDLYRAVYCGLCAAMRRRYGWLAPMFLNYDFTFLALLLAPPEEAFSPCRGRCHANPLRKKTMYQPTPALDTAADESVVLTWWQLRDRARDDRGWKGWTARALARLNGEGVPVVLEIDPPRDEVSIRRQHFYERCGFTANPYRHVHPPYRAGYQGHPLVVMTCPAPASQEEYDRFAAYLGGTVMEDCKIPLTETEE